MTATAEVIDAQVIEEEEPMVPAVVSPATSAAGTAALAQLSDSEFDRRLTELKAGRERVAKIQQSLMVQDVDYGLIPGTPKPTLLKPGAEKLCDFYRLAARIETTFIQGDGVAEPILRYDAICYLHLGTLDGPVVANGAGTANSWERRYRYRRADRTCPECGKAGALNKSKHQPEFYCWAKKGGCGATFPLTDPRITGQELGDVENTDPWDLAVTLLKMSEKRAHVDATLRATATSGLFTQDVEDGQLHSERTDGESAFSDEQPIQQVTRGATAQLRQRATTGQATNGLAISNDEWSDFWKTARRQGYRDNRAVLKVAQHIWPDLQSIGDLSVEQFTDLKEAVSQPASGGTAK